VIDATSVATLHSVCPDAKLLFENGKPLIFLPRLKIRVGSTIKTIDALLCPSEHSGYMTRLFLAEPISECQSIKGQPANWSVHQLLSKMWHTWSWQNVPADLPILQILIAHVKAFE
jgi:hypothetical protein